MRWNRTVVCAFLVAAVGGILRAQADSDVLSVRIVPTNFADAGPRGITLSGPSQHFSVVITNIGRDSIRLWRQTCSWGYANLSFEAKDANGATVAVTKKQRGWEKNFPDWITIPPGDHFVVDVAFDVASWQNSPLPKAGQQKLVSLRAFYEIPADPETKANKVWVGKVASPQNMYAIFH
jgi:hypothetical protein